MKLLIKRTEQVKKMESRVTGRIFDLIIHYIMSLFMLTFDISNHIYGDICKINPGEYFMNEASLVYFYFTSLVGFFLLKVLKIFLELLENCFRNFIAKCDLYGLNIDAEISK